MKTIRLIARIVAFLVTVLMLPNTSAHAQDAFLAGGATGTCSVTSPCGLLSSAISAVASGGTIHCFGTGEYFFAGMVITKSLTIDCPGSSIDAGTADGVVINGTDIVVILRNFTLNGFAPFNGSIGINFINGSALHVENVNISGLGKAPAIGIKFAPTTAARLYVSNSSISDSGNGAVGGGIVVSPSGSGSARVMIERTTITNNVFGIAVDGSNSNAGINMTVADSVTSGNTQDGIVATTSASGAPIGVMLKNTKSVNNYGFGIRSIGPNVTVRADSSSVIGNGTGLSFSGGGTLLSFGNNNVRANATDGAFSGSVGLQ